MYTTCPDYHTMSGVVKTHISDHFLTFTTIGSKRTDNLPNVVHLGTSNILLVKIS